MEGCQLVDGSGRSISAETACTHLVWRQPSRKPPQPQDVIQNWSRQEGFLSTSYELSKPEVKSQT